MRRILLDPQGGEGNGTDKETRTKETPDLAVIAEKIIKKYGTADIAVMKLADENYSHRDEIRQLKEKLPPTGSVVLTADQAREWETYRELGKPTDLRKSRDQATQDAEKVRNLERKELLRTVQDLHGYRPSVLGPLVEKLDLRDGEAKGKDGKPVRQITVVEQGDDSTEKVTPLPEWIEANRSEFLPALLPETQRTPGSPPPRQSPAPPPADGKRLIGDGVDRATEQLRNKGMRYTRF